MADVATARRPATPAGDVPSECGRGGARKGGSTAQTPGRLRRNPSRPAYPRDGRCAMLRRRGKPGAREPCEVPRLTVRRRPSTIGRCDGPALGRSPATGWRRLWDKTTTNEQFDASSRSSTASSRARTIGLVAVHSQDIPRAAGRRADHEEIEPRLCRSRHRSARLRPLVAPLLPHVRWQVGCTRAQTVGGGGHDDARVLSDRDG